MPQAVSDVAATPQAAAQFWADALHALAQPVQALALFSDRLRRLAVGAQAAPVVEQVNASVQDLQSLLYRLVQVAQMDAGHLSVRPEAVSVDALCARLRRHTDARPQTKGLRWRSQGQEVFSDPLLLERLSLALIDHALEIAQGGSVLLAWRSLRGQGAVRMELWWRGSGLPACEKSQFFAPFGPAPVRSQSRSLQGEVVLYTAQRLAQLLGSRVEVLSRPGRPVCLSVRLPVTACETP